MLLARFIARSARCPPRRHRCCCSCPRCRSLTIPIRDDPSTRPAVILRAPLAFLALQVIDVLHPNKATVSKKDLKDILAKEYKVNDDKTIFSFGFRTAFGGQRSTGFAVIYDTLEDALDSEPAYRLIRAGLKTKSGVATKKMRSELKNKKNKVRGKAKAAVGMGKKK